jgi:hypothetical protein
MEATAPTSLDSASIRVVLRDRRHEVGFAIAPPELKAILASATRAPDSANDLLVGAELYAPGLVRRVVGQLMAFDLAHRGAAEGDGVDVPALISPEAFEVMDADTAGLARTPLDGGLLLVDLAGKGLFTLGELATQEIDHCIVGPGAQTAGPSVTFALPHDWIVQRAKTAAELPVPLAVPAAEWRRLGRIHS